MSVNKKYILMQGLFWMLYCAAGSFISLYLLDKGWDNTGIGAVTAFFGAISAVLQPVLGKLCDKSSRFTWKNLLQLFLGVFLFICVLMLVIPGKTAGALLIGLMFFSANMIMPLVNGAMSYYQQQNEYVNFGVARGTGSGLYALIALLIGNLAESYGVGAVPAAGLVISALLLGVVLQMPCKHIQSRPSESTTSAKKGFGKRYPAFLMMTAAFILLSAAHYILGNYLLQIIQSLGGGSRQLGVAMAIQALLELPVLFGFSWLLKRFRAKTLMVYASIGYVIKTVAYALAQNITAIYLIQLTQTISFAIFASASVYYVLETVSDQDQITGQAFMTGTLVAGNVLGSLLGGWILDRFGVPSMLYTNIGIASAGMILAFLSDRMLIKTQKTW